MGLPDDADVSSEDPAVRGATGKTAARPGGGGRPHELGADYLCGVLYSQLGKYPGAGDGQRREPTWSRRSARSRTEPARQA